MRPKHWRAALAVMLALALAGPPAVVGPVSAARAASTFTVNSTLDEDDANPGDGLCASTPSGVCTVRAAIMETNALPGTDTIALPAGRYVLSLGGGDDTGAFGDLDILDSVTITGADASATTVTANPGSSWQDRLFDVVALSATVTMTGLTVGPGGMTLDDGGGIRNRGALTLRNVVLTGNRALGGGLYNLGSATLTDVTVNGNQGQTTGGAILNAGSLTATRLVIGRNSAVALPGIVHPSTEGGGLYNSGQATLTDAVVDDNHAEYGGGIYNTGTLTLNRVLVSRNRAAGLSRDSVPFGLGGGIINYGTLTATNVTVSGNQAARGVAGISVGASGSATLTNVTIAANDSTGAGQSLTNAGGTLRLKNTLVYRATDDNCAGPVTSLGNNIDSGNSCGFNAPADQSNAEPLLGPLQDNGGFSQTHALQPGSPAIDTAADGACPSDDQRRQPRPFDGNGDGNRSCDIGAYELQATQVPVACVPRPPIQVAVARNGPDALLATITAPPPASGAPDRLRALRFGRVTNATVDAGGQTGLGANQTVTLPDAPTQTTVVVHRGPNGASATVEILVIDDCGTWSTFVGGGPNAWGGPAAGPTAPTPVARPAASPTPVPTPPTATSTPLAACTPRQAIVVKTEAAGPGRLQVTLTAGQGGLTRLQFDIVGNAVVDVAGQTGLTSNAVVLLPGAPKQLTLLVRRLDATKPVTVPLTVTDGCGGWQTLVGGGPTAF